MGRPVGGYRTSAGKKVPGVTTITGRYKDAGGLIHWAWSEGIEGRDYKESRDRAGDAGTVAHTLVEHRIRKLGKPEFPGVPEEVVARGWKAFRSYLRWEEQTKMVTVHTEIPLVYQGYACPLHPDDGTAGEPAGSCLLCGGPLAPVEPFGGTFDAVGQLDGTADLALLDWKTGNSVYGEMLYQLAAYVLLLRHGSMVDERGWATGQKLGLRITAGLHLLRFGKEHGDFHHHHWPQDAGFVPAAIEGFRHMSRLYELDKLVRKAV